MAIKVMPSTTREFVLEESDKLYNEANEPPTRVTIRQASQGDAERRSNLFSKWRTSMNSAGENSLEQEFNYNAVKRLDVYLTLTDSNITNGATGKSLFTFKDGRLESQVSFDKAWDMLPVPMADEIHNKVLEMNPDWDLTQGE